MKRIFCVIALCLALPLALCGCGGEKKDEFQSSPSPEEVSAPPEQDAAESVPPEPAPAEEETPAPIPEPPASPSEFVRVRDYIPDIAVDLRYATDGNFTGEVIYNYTDAWLRYGTVEKLVKAQDLLKEQGYRICIWDAFRSTSAQDRLWAVYPDGNYVANPANGYSGHTRGDTVDITLVTLDGGPVEMPSGFDNFSALADRDYSDVSELQAQNARLLEQIMAQCGFSGYQMEWWHYSDQQKYPPELQFTPPAD